MAAKAKDNDSHPESLPTVNRLTPHAGFFQSPPVIAAGADSFLAISFCFLRPIPPHVRGLLYGDFAFRASLKVLAEEGMGKETRAKLICDRCRKGHLKCDNEQPDCGRCKAAGKRCHRSTDIKFRKRLNTTNFSESVRPRPSSDGSRAQGHDGLTWVNTNDAPIRFVDVTSDITNDTAKSPGNESSTGSESTPTAPQHTSPQPPIIFRNSGIRSHNLPVPSLAPVAPVAPVPPIAPALPLSQPSTSFKHTGTLTGSSGSDANPPWDFGLGSFEPTSAFNTDMGLDHPMVFGNELSETLQFPSITTPPSLLPHRSSGTAITAKSLELREAKLVRHYQEHLAPWLDISNRDRYFEMTIPTQSIQSPCLLNAILGISARHLSRISDYDPKAYEGYVRRCLASYEPPLSEQEGDELLALTGILRLFEGLEVSLTSFDPHSPLSSFEDMAWSRSAHFSNSAFSQLLIRSGLRQDIHTSFFRQEAVTSLLDSVILDKTLGPADDFMWADRMLVHLGDILRFCFGAADSSPLSWNQLMDYSTQWWESRPHSFAPLYYKDAESGKLFPQIWMSSDCQVAALQHYHLGMVMLKVYNPRIPRLGPSRKEWLQVLEKETKFHIAQVCGVALSNPRVVPALLTACHAIATCGESFKEKWEQDQLLEILTMARREHGWTTSTLQTQLKDAWGYESPV